jgi:hypothetical protein
MTLNAFVTEYITHTLSVQLSAVCVIHMPNEIWLCNWNYLWRALQHWNYFSFKCINRISHLLTSAFERDGIRRFPLTLSRRKNCWAENIWHDPINFLLFTQKKNEKCKRRKKWKFHIEFLFCYEYDILWLIEDKEKIFTFTTVFFICDIFLRLKMLFLHPPAHQNS